MVLAVHYGHKMGKKVVFWLGLTIIGGLIFLGSQAGMVSLYSRDLQRRINEADGSIAHYVAGSTQEII